MLVKPPACSSCPIEFEGRGFVPAFGTGSNKVALIGMAPAKNEVEQGIPFVGRAGTVLSKILRKVGNREEFSIWNILQCQGPNDALTFEGAQSAIDHCSIHRHSFHDCYRPLVRVGMGGIPFHVLTGNSIPIGKARGYRFETEEGPVIPTFHPSFLGRGKMNLIPVVIWDILTALKERNQPPVEFPYPDLTLVPNPSEFEEWCKEAKHSSFIVHDIETPYSKKQDSDEDDEDPSYTILRFSLARDDFKAITAPFQEPFISMWKEIANERMEKIGWNSDSFDDPREAANGIPMRGRRVDAQWLAHFLMPTIPRGLGFRTTFYARTKEWKSMGSSQDNVNAELYSCMDSWATARCFVGIREALRKRRV